MTGFRDPRLDVTIPDGFRYLWDWFWQLSNRRGSSGFGPMPVSWEAIAAWSAATGIRPTRWGMMTIQAMDNAFMAAYAAMPKGET